MLTVPENFKFKLYELVPKDIYEKYGEKAWLLLDPRILEALHKMRTRYNKKIIVNNWYFVKPSDGVKITQYCGWRPGDCKDGAALSQHKFGRGIDAHIESMLAAEARKDIIANKEYFDTITCLEEDVSWVHLDCRILYPGESRIKLVYPS